MKEKANKQSIENKKTNNYGQIHVKLVDFFWSVNNLAYVQHTIVKVLHG